MGNNSGEARLASTFDAKAARFETARQTWDKIPLITGPSRLKTQLYAYNKSQADYFELIQQNDITFGLGPAGTGKTYLAVAAAANALISGAVQRLILTRPAVEAGERLGFLPGDMKEKVDPYLRPIYDALHDCMAPEQVERRIAAGEIEIAPIAFMRGRTLADAFIILDEAQNTTKEQMKMFLTRFGQGSTMVICGDDKQCDLPNMKYEYNGLQDAVLRNEGSNGIGVHRFDVSHVVRHPTVATIINNYAKVIPPLSPPSPQPSTSLTRTGPG